MKKSVYRIQAWGNKDTSHDIELLLDYPRELNSQDEQNIREHLGALMASIHEETYRLDPDKQLDAAKEREELISCFGDRNIFVESVPNGYCSSWCCKHLPWYVVTTNKGRIKIGWRKRVIQIEWTDSLITGKAEELFPDEDVTRFEKVIHAWSLAKAKEYIDKILN